MSHVSIGDEKERRWVKEGDTLNGYLPFPPPVAPTVSQGHRLDLYFGLDTSE